MNPLYDADVLATTQPPKATLTDEELRNLRSAFDIHLEAYRGHVVNTFSFKVRSDLAEPFVDWLRENTRNYTYTISRVRFHRDEATIHVSWDMRRYPQ